MRRIVIQPVRAISLALVVATLGFGTNAGRQGPIYGTGEGNFALGTQAARGGRS